MEFQELLPRRRMVRHYVPEPVPPDKLERIVATVRRAPSAGYSQGQRLLVPPADEARATTTRILGEAGWTTPDDRAPWLGSAPVHVLVCTRAAPDPAWSAVTSRRTQPRREQAESVRWDRWDS